MMACLDYDQSFKIFSMNNNLFIVINSLFSLIPKFKEYQAGRILRQYFMFWTKLIKTQGLIHSVKYLKQVRLHCTRYMCGDPLRTNDMHIGLDTSGWPKCVSYLKPFIDDASDIMGQRFALTLLCLTRTIIDNRRDVTLKLSTITDPFNGSSELKIPVRFIKKFVRHFRLNQEKPCFSEKNIFLSTKQGPQGSSTMSMLYSILRLGYNQLQYIFNLSDTDGQNWICKIYTFAWNKLLLTNKLGQEKVFSGKLSVVRDPECKLRVIAMLDGVSQQFLRPIHDHLMSNLSKMPCDRTYTQNPWHHWNSDDNKFWSMDLSAATDRFPLTLQEELLSIIYRDEKFAWSWGKLLTDREFWVKEGPYDKGGNDSQGIRYSVGQPMGAYSSWAAFSLCHHLVVHFCAKLAGFHNFEFDQYILLGDDIVIKNDIVAKHYKTIMASLGVELSIAKTHVSKDTYEFAKRWIKLGNEITPFPILGLVENIHNPFLVYTILFDYARIKNCVFPIKKNLLSFVVDLCSIANREIYGKLAFLYRKPKNFIGPQLSPEQWSVMKKHLLSKRSYSNRLRSFSFSLRNTFGMASYDELRSILCSIKNESFVIPGERISQEIYSWVLKLGSEKLVSSSNLRLVNVAKEIKNNIQKLDISDPNDLGNVPVFLSIFNNLESKQTLLSDFDQNKISMREFSERLINLDVTKILDKNRIMIENHLTIGDAWISGIKSLEEVGEELYYGSLGISHIESTLSRTMGPNLKFALSELLRYRNGTWVDPNSRISAWEAWG